MMLGKIAFNESTMSTITARMPGRIDRLFVNYTGIAVKKGDHIAEVYSPDLLLAQQELIQSLKLVKTSKPGDEFAARTLNSVKEKYRLWGFSDEQVQEIISRRSTPQLCYRDQLVHLRQVLSETSPSRRYHLA